LISNLQIRKYALESKVDFEITVSSGYMSQWKATVRWKRLSFVINYIQCPFNVKVGKES
jgi:hypothetical protein